MSNSITFNYTGDMSSWTIPSTTNELEVILYGAAGGGNIDDNTDNGGLGGKISATLTVTGGETLYLFTGGKGTDTQDTSNNDFANPGGYNGGGNGGYDNDNVNTIQVRNGSGGGGASDIRIDGSGLEHRVVVAGGGGGSGYAGSGGNGGGTTGASGSTSNSTYGTGGPGGSQTSGGQISNTYGANNGVEGLGGNAGTLDNSGFGCGGGGGGFYGGASGTITSINPYGNSAGGGGGSSWVNEVTSKKAYLKTGTSATHVQGDSTATGNGSITITYNDNLPDISSVSWSVINSKLSAQFNEAVYNTSSGSGTLEHLILPYLQAVELLVLIQHQLIYQQMII